MSRDRYGVDDDRLISQPAGDEGPLEDSGHQTEKKTPEDRVEGVDNLPFRKGQKQWAPDPSRTSPAERYSFHKRPLE